MLKESRAYRLLARSIGAAANELALEVLRDTGKDDLKGREETITPQIAGELTRHLFDRVKQNLDGKMAMDVQFRVHCFKHKEENKIGADIAGVMTIKNGNYSVSKLYLAQAKIAQFAKSGSHNKHIRAGDANLLRQCDAMLDHTSASYVFVYSELGVHVIPANAVKLKGRGCVDTREDHYKSLNLFYADYFKCFIGDSTLGGRLATSVSADEAFQKLKVSNGLEITAEFKQSELFAE